MKVLDEKVVELLQSESLWWIGTFDEESNVVPVGFKNVEADGTLSVGAVFLDHTIENIKKNGKVTIAAGGSKGMTGYQIHGTAKFITDGPVVDNYKVAVEKMFKGQATAKGALVITPERVIVATPGPKNNWEF